MQQSSSKWEIIVYRLPNFDIDGRTDVRAPYRERVGKIPFNPQTYEDEITTLFARPGLKNIFVCEVRKDGIYYSVLPVLRTAPPSPQEMPGLYASPAQTTNGATQTIIQPAPLPPVDPLANIREALKLIADVKKVFPEAEAATPIQQPQINTTEQALLHLMNQDGSMVETIADKLKGLMRSKDNGREIGWMDLVMEAIKSDVFPKMIREARNLMLETRQNGMPANPQAQATPQGLSNTQPNGNGTDQANNLNTLPQNLPPEIALLNLTIQDCVQQLPAPEAAARIEAFATLHPTVNPFIDMFIGMTPDMVLAWLSNAIPQAASITQLPYAKDWVSALQEELQTGEGNHDETK
jgi:hypothetical protein